jgi:acetyl-CoA C-acetyltransferase
LVISGLLLRHAAHPSRKDIDEVVFGQMLTAGQGQNPARQAAIKAGIADSATAWTLNQVCGSGLQGGRHRGAADPDRRRHHHDGRRSGERCRCRRIAPTCAPAYKMGDYKMIDTMIKDGLWDAFNGYHMGTTAENVAKQWQITRDQQDQFAVASQNKAEAAQKAGKFKDEIAPVTIVDPQGRCASSRTTSISSTAPRSTASGKLRPAFDKEGTVTAGNASGINDGAAATVL